MPGLDVLLKRLINESHDVAIKQGFWQGEETSQKLGLGRKLLGWFSKTEDTNNLWVPAKLALVATEIKEFEASWDPTELADICLRVFDLAGYLRIMLEEDCMEGTDEFYDQPTPASVKEMTHEMYGYVATAVQEYRKGEQLKFELCLSMLVKMCFDYKPGLLGTIQQKMAENRLREYRHGGRKY